MHTSACLYCEICVREQTYRHKHMHTYDLQACLFTAPYAQLHQTNERLQFGLFWFVAYVVFNIANFSKRTLSQRSHRLCVAAADIP